MLNSYIIVPGCSDLNRGDQALAWETKHLAEDAGFVGNYSIISESDEPVSQTESHGIHAISPVLEHPSRLFKSKSNISYTRLLKVQWGVVACLDFLKSVLLLNKFTRPLGQLFLKGRNKESYEHFKNAKAVFMKGGGLIQTYGGVTSTYSAFFWCFHMRLAQSLGIPVYIMPNSFGPFKGPFVKTIVRRMMKKCKLVTARESFTQKMVQRDLGLNLPLYPDLAFFLPKTSGMSKSMFCEKFSLPKNRKLVAITVRPYRFPESDHPEEDYLSYQKSVADFARWLYANNYMPVFVEHTLAVNAHENDAACIKEVIAMLEPDQYCYVSDPNMNCQDLKAFYSICDYTVGTRFHSVIFSLSEEVPSLAISYVGNKSTGIMNDIGLSDYVFSINNINSKALIKSFERLVGNKEIVIEKVRHYKEYCRVQRKNLCAQLQMN